MKGCKRIARYRSRVNNHKHTWFPVRFDTKLFTGSCRHNSIKTQSLIEVRQNGLTFPCREKLIQITFKMLWKGLSIVKDFALT